MNDQERTRTSASSGDPATDRPLLCLTIVWHPDLARIGEQCLALRDTFELTRYQPLFTPSDTTRTGDDAADLGLPLGYEGISRQPLLITRGADDKISIMPPASRMVLELNGQAMGEPALLSAAQVETGVVLCLARAVVLCLHFMRCVPKHNPIDGLLGVGTAAIKTRDLIRQVAATKETVLLLGETGTGKEVAARAIHRLSLRHDKALVSVNMAALNEGLAAAELFGAAKGAYTGAQNTRGGYFQEAQDATLFLDEIGNAPAPVQPMLLRVLETGDYRPLGASRDAQTSARIIAATDQDLHASGFNHALLRRLESFTIPIPPLRARREDIGLLIVHTLQTSDLPDCAHLRPPATLVAEMARYEWPGNIRQLRHMVKRILLAIRAGNTPTLATLLDAPQPALTAMHPAIREPLASEADNLASPERRTSKLPSTGGVRQKPAALSEADILLAMQKSAWSIRGAAQALHISRTSLYGLLEVHSQIRRPEQIPLQEILSALSEAQDDVATCAGKLHTPAEALRRYLRLQQYL